MCPSADKSVHRSAHLGLIFSIFIALPKSPSLSVQTFIARNEYAFDGDIVETSELLQALSQQTPPVAAKRFAASTVMGLPRVFDPDLLCPNRRQSYFARVSACHTVHQVRVRYAAVKSKCCQHAPRILHCIEISLGLKEFCLHRCTRNNMSAPIVGFRIVYAAVSQQWTVRNRKYL